MKFLSRLLIVLSLSSIAFFTTSCEDNENNNEKNSILDLALNDPNLKTFANALLVTKLDETLIGSEYTVFAPTDEAFKSYLEKSGYYSTNARKEILLEKVPANLLKELLLNHIISGKLNSDQLTTGYVKTLAKSSISKQSTIDMFIDVSNGVMLNGVAKVTTANIPFSSGIVHKVDAVNDFPFILTHAKLNPKLTSLVDAVTKNADAAFIETLAMTKFYDKDKPLKFFDPIVGVTLLAPTNDAFTALNTELAPGGINSVSKIDLFNILKYHGAVDYIIKVDPDTKKETEVKLSTNILASNLKEGQKLPTLYTKTLRPEELTIELAGGAKVKDNKGRTANIVTTDIQCWNGVIHLIDKVMLPN